MKNQPKDLKNYHVSLGHSVVHVQATSPEEAVAAARRQLALELPRLYDVIFTLTQDRFKVLQAA
mgnify:CR=1 FL=1